MKHFIFLILLFHFYCSSFSQDTFKLSYKKDFPLFTIGTGLLVAGQIFEHNLKFETVNQALRPERINRFDSHFFTDYNTNFHFASDVLFYGSLLSASVIYIAKGTHNNKIQIFGLAAEGLILNYGVASLVKVIVKRPRPFLYNEPFIYDQNDADSRLSFYSGHTSNIAYLSYFSASLLKKAGIVKGGKVWLLAAIPPVFMGAFRVLAGKHFVSDVITGAAIGAGFGLLIPLIH